jgi:hypothetical protein
VRLIGVAAPHRDVGQSRRPRLRQQVASRLEAHDARGLLGRQPGGQAEALGQVPASPADVRGKIGHPQLPVSCQHHPPSLGDLRRHRCDLPAPGEPAQQRLVQQPEALGPGRRRRHPLHQLVGARPSSATSGTVPPLSSAAGTPSRAGAASGVRPYCTPSCGTDASIAAGATCRPPTTA